MKDDAIAPLNCMWCGKKIPPGRGGRGYPPKTCSEECRKARASALERARYARVKNTPDWQETRAAYIEELRRRFESDPEFAEKVRERRVECLRRSRARRDPDRIERDRESGRRWYRELREELESDPELIAQFRAKQRARYRGLSQAEKERIYIEPRRRRLRSG